MPISATSLLVIIRGKMSTNPFSLQSSAQEASNTKRDVAARKDPLAYETMEQTQLQTAITYHCLITNCTATNTLTERPCGTCMSRWKDESLEIRALPLTKHCFYSLAENSTSRCLPLLLYCLLRSEQKETLYVTLEVSCPTAIHH